MMGVKNHQLVVALAICHWLSVAGAQTVLTAQVWSTFIYTRYGERTPFIFPNSLTLTPLGAQQLFQAGASFRQRYVEPVINPEVEYTTIRNISPYQLSQDQLTILSTDDQYISASAQAFLQGLYPPLESSSNYTYITGLSNLANGTNVVAPLNGIQYPNILTASSNDLNSIWVAGMNDCPMYTSSASDYYASSEYETIEADTQSFYSSLQPDFLDGYFSNASVGYYDAYYIYDYLSYAYTHNTTVAETLSPEDLTRAEILADDWVFAMNANTTASGSTAGDHIRAIAGRTLANKILEAFYTTINTQGRANKMTLLFGSFEPMVSFAALAQLVNEQNAAFYDTPAPGSSFVFELFSLLTANDTAAYPDSSDLYVRFFYQNGTGDYSSLVAYPLFGRSPSEIMMPLEDFIMGIQDFMIFSVADWCTTCGSYSVFCPAFEGTDTSSSTSGSSSESESSTHHAVSPAVGGVIGAVVTLVVAGLLFGLVMLFGGVRMHRVQTKRRSELGGFKGAEKLASDQDLTLPKGVAGPEGPPDAAPAPIRGHERVGSWELKDQAKAEEAQGRSLHASNIQAGRPSFEDDDINVNPFAHPVKPHDQV